MAKLCTRNSRIVFTWAQSLFCSGSFVNSAVPIASLQRQWPAAASAALPGEASMPDPRRLPRHHTKPASSLLLFVLELKLQHLTLTHGQGVPVACPVVSCDAALSYRSLDRHVSDTQMLARLAFEIAWGIVMIVGSSLCPVG